MASMNYGRFVLYTAIGALVWAIGFPLLGYFLGQQLPPEARSRLDLIVIAIFAASIAPIAVHLLRERAKSKTTLTRA